MPSGVYPRNKPGEQEPVRPQSIDWPFALWQRIRKAADTEKISFRDYCIRALERELARKEK